MNYCYIYLEQEFTTPLGYLKLWNSIMRNFFPMFWWGSRYFLLSILRFYIGKMRYSRFNSFKWIFEELTLPLSIYFLFLTTFVLSLRVLMFRFLGSVFDILYERFGDLPWLWFDHHTVTRSCMHTDFLRLRGEGTGVPGAPLSLWQGEVLSFVISSPVPSVRVASVVSEYVREIGRYCLFVWWDYLSSPPFSQYLFVLKFLIFELRDLNISMHTIFNK